MSNPISGVSEIPEMVTPPVGVDAGPKFAFQVIWDMKDDRAFPFTSLTSKQTVIEIHGIRGNDEDVSTAARTSWDGNPDQVLVLRARNYALNDASQGAQRALMVQCQNRSGGRIYWMRGMDIEIDNRGTVGDSEKALRIGVRNNSVVTGNVVGIELEMLGQAAAGDEDIAVDFIHNDASSVSYPICINVRGSRATNGFVYLLRTEQYGIDKKGVDSADSAMFKFYDDSENCDLDANGILVDINNTANAGWIKVIVGTTVRYIAIYAKKTS